MITVKCCVCGAVYDTKWDGSDDVQVSHGYCKSCAEKTLSNLRAERNDRHQVDDIYDKGLKLANRKLRARLYACGIKGRGDIDAAAAAVFHEARSRPEAMRALEKLWKVCAPHEVARDRWQARGLTNLVYAVAAAIAGTKWKRAPRKEPPPILFSRDTDGTWKELQTMLLQKVTAVFDAEMEGRNGA